MAFGFSQPFLRLVEQEGDGIGFMILWPLTCAVAAKRDEMFAVGKAAASEAVAVATSCSRTSAMFVANAIARGTSLPHG